MEKEVTIAVVAGCFGLLGTALSIWATITAQSVRREMQVRLLEPRLGAYRQLWALMTDASPSLEREFTEADRAKLEQDLRDWYYKDGSGLFLSAESRALLVEAKDLLVKSKGTSADIRKKLSHLRSQMKNDVGVYGKENPASNPKI